MFVDYLAHDLFHGHIRAEREVAAPVRNTVSVDSYF